MPLAEKMQPIKMDVVGGPKWGSNSQLMVEIVTVRSVISLLMHL